MEQSQEMLPLLDLAVDLDTQLHEMIQRLSEYDLEDTGDAIEALRQVHAQIRTMILRHRPGD